MPFHGLMTLKISSILSNFYIFLEDNTMIKNTNPCFTVSQGKDKKFYWVLTARNGKIILRSKKGYATKQNAQKNISYVIKSGQNIENYFTDTANQAGNGLYYILQGKNGNLLAISGNGKNYKSVNWQICNLGANKGILSCIASIDIAKNKPY